jgi:hypothetical protein
MEATKMTILKSEQGTWTTPTTGAKLKRTSNATRMAAGFAEGRVAIGNKNMLVVNSF